MRRYWSMVVRISYVVASFMAIAFVYQYSDDLARWVFEKTEEMINSQFDQILQGVIEWG